MNLSTLTPLFIFIATFVVLAAGLDKDPRLVPSPLIDRPVPAFILPDLIDSTKSVSAESIQNRVALINVWASWCSGCRREHEVLLKIAENGELPIIGIDYKDERIQAQKWLNKLGNPYSSVAYDEDGRTGIDFGVYGVPETYVVDRQGVIRYKHTGPLTHNILETHIMPLIRALKKGRNNEI